MMSRLFDGVRADVANVCRGFLMGGADVIPGVSGGTVALVLGIYQRLVTALSHVDGTLASHVRHRRFREASCHVDLRFLASLAFGIAMGIVLMTLLMNRLLTDAWTRSLTLAVFFGLIAGSAVVVWTTIDARSRSQLVVCVVLAVGGGLFAFGLTRMTSHPRDPSYAYVFFCGCVAICAMILPGISGAMILLILGIYLHLTEIPRNLLHGRQVAEGLTTILVFGTGAAISLVLFSKLLRWLLARYHAGTMAVLCGLMVGALPKLWPFQLDRTPQIESFKYKRFALVLPEAVDGHVVAVAAVAFAAAAIVLALDWHARRRRARGIEGN